MDSLEKIRSKLQKEFPSVKKASKWLSFSADLHLKAKNIDEALRIYRLASKLGFAVLPLGAGTLLPPKEDKPTVALTLPRKKGSLDLRPERLTLEADCSATIGEVTGALDKAGMALRHLPSNSNTTLGGWMGSFSRGAERMDRGGREWPIIGAEYILYGGRKGFVGRRTMKGVAGYELSRLMQGKWGRVGLAESLVLRLRPKAPTQKLALICPGEPSGWVEVFGELPFRLTTLLGLELVDRSVVPFVSWPVSGPRFAMLAWFAGPPRAVDDELSRMVGAVSGGGSMEVGEDGRWLEELADFRRIHTEKGEMRQLLYLEADGDSAPRLMTWADNQGLGEVILVGHLIDGEYELYLRGEEVPQLPDEVKVKRRIRIAEGRWRLSEAPRIDPLVEGIMFGG